MKTVSGDLQIHLGEDTTTLASMWKVSRKDGSVFGFTDHDQDIEFEGLTYKAASGFNATAAETSAGMNVDDLEIHSLLNSSSITEASLLAGQWDDAEVVIFAVNWQDPSAGALKLRRGWIGAVRKKTGTFVAELRGIAQKLQQPLGRTVQPGCDATFGDARCKLDLANFVTTGYVSAVSSRMVFQTDTFATSNALFQYGRVLWQTGQNAALEMEIRATDDAGQFWLFLPMAYDIAVGDRFAAYQGCQKSRAACMAYGNIVNFRGFPDLPVSDVLVRGANP